MRLWRNDDLAAIRSIEAKVVPAARRQHAPIVSSVIIGEICGG